VLKTPRSTYTRELVALQKYLDTEIRNRTGQAEPVVLVMSQTRSASHVLDSEPFIAMAQLDADGLAGIRLAAPMYKYGRSDMGHLDIIGENRQGQACERAFLAECYGQGWAPVRPVHWMWNSPAQIDIQFHVPVGPLVLDTQGDVDVKVTPTVKGFDFLDGTPAPPRIVDVSLVPGSEDTVRIQLAASSKGTHPRIGYAIHKNDAASPADCVEGARGCVRDSANHVSLYDQHVNHNWCAMFAIDLPPLPSP
jgi:hypothetical protein